MANCLILSVLDTLNLYSSGNPIKRFISKMLICLFSFVKTGIMAPPPLLLTANVGNGKSREYARIPLERICKMQSSKSHSSDTRSNFFLVFGISNDTDTSDYSVYNHLTSKEERTMGSISHDSSVMYSLIYAYKEAAKIDSNVKLDYKLSGIKVYYRSVNSLFRVGDFIYKINDFDVNNDIENFVNAYNTKKTGDLFYIIRDGEEKCITYQNFTDDNWYTFYAYYDINYTTASPRIKVNSATSGGPSAGLLQTLSIFNRLTTNDYTMGLKIAGTGTIDVSGNVGAIGAIKQKVITASNNNADIFFCPKANSEEGKSAYDSLSSSKRKKMKFVIVEKFSDATNYLKELYEATN